MMVTWIFLIFIVLLNRNKFTYTGPRDTTHNFKIIENTLTYQVIYLGKTPVTRDILQTLPDKIMLRLYSGKIDKIIDVINLNGRFVGVQPGYLMLMNLTSIVALGLLLYALVWL